ncbi:MAG: aconitate hydratase AcnA, partial [Chloroflexi bacterium]|nr:aconitate hydratase AcnA [Chloroflexota bacterium]
RVPLSNVKHSFLSHLVAAPAERGFGLAPAAAHAAAAVTREGESFDVVHGSVVIAAITSCTNTSNPSVMLGAGLLAKKAVAVGLTSKPWVKTSMAPGSKVVTDYLDAANVMGPLEALGFHTVGYGCTTCIGNSGPLPDEIASAIEAEDLVAVAVLSGNRNFEGRISPSVKANYLGSPILVVAYALAGRIDIDLTTEPIGQGRDGEAIYLRDLWPTQAEIREAVHDSLNPEMFEREYGRIFDGDEQWAKLPAPSGDLYAWEATSTYIKEPPFFEGFSLDVPPVRDLHGARILAVLGDSVTTDHISPAGNIAARSPAGEHLLLNEVAQRDFNSYGSRRGNHEVMMRGTFANVRLKNLMVPGAEGNFTLKLPEGNQTTIYDAAMDYAREGTPLVLIGGKEYGSGSSRDWAAKGPYLLGVRAVIAESYERIHRSNLIGMGVMPLQFLPGENASTLGLNAGTAILDIIGLESDLAPGKGLQVVARHEDGSETRFVATARVDTQVEIDYYRNGGILQTVLRSLLTESNPAETVGS